MSRIVIEREDYVALWGYVFSASDRREIPPCTCSWRGGDHVQCLNCRAVEIANIEYCRVVKRRFEERMEVKHERGAS